jgi:peptide/nickel transport system ATP-binding protein
MGVVAEMADRVIVMQSGKMVEAASTEMLFADPAQQYTRDLLAAVPRLGGGANRRAVTADPVVKLEDVVVRFPLRGGVFGRVTHHVHAVEHVSFDIYRGETFSLVGESGCGKSTIAKAMVGLAPHDGRIAVAGQPLRELDANQWQAMRKRVQIVFQDPMASLNPRMRVGQLLRNRWSFTALAKPKNSKRGLLI